MNMKFLGTIILVGLLSGSFVFFKFKTKPSNKEIKTSKTFSKKRYIIKMKDSALVEIFNQWDKSLFTNTNSTGKNFEVYYDRSKDMIALDKIIGGERFIVDTNYFKRDKEQFKFLFQQSADTIYVPVRVITQYFNSTN